MRTNSNGNGIKVVSFDAWLTLIKSNATPNKATRAGALYELLGMQDRGVSLADFQTVIKTAEKTGDVRSEDGIKHYGPYERTELVLAHYGIPMLTDAQFSAFYAGQSQRFMEFPPELMQDDVIDVLTALAAKYRLALMSNTGFVNGAEMRPALKAIGLLDLFTYQLFSNEVGANKPHPKIYQALLDQSGTTPGQIVHIGDNRKADYDGATAMGMQAIHLPSTMTIREAVATLL
jgi:putative hydrolase of the HAD superfamily